MLALRFSERIIIGVTEFVLFQWTVEHVTLSCFIILSHKFNFPSNFDASNNSTHIAALKILVKVKI